MKIIYFDSLPSTNQYCELLDLSKVEEFAVYAALEQTAGIGQRGNHWDSEKGANLTFSLILKPSCVPIADQYQLTKTVSLGITDWLKTLLPPSLTHSLSIKWPNDIYIGQKKICGTLITTKLAQGIISSAIVGIGLNINQTSFAEWVPNPTSLSLITSLHYGLTDLLPQLIDSIERRYHDLQQNLHAPDADYLQLLLNRGIEKQYEYHGQMIRATIQDVNRFGHLCLTLADGNNITCQMKEIKFLF